MAVHQVPPGPRGFLPGGQLLYFRRTPENFLRLTRDYGDMVHFKVGPERFYLVNDPALIKEVLVTLAASFVKGWGPQPGHSFLGRGLFTAEGEHHRCQRRLIQPAFHAAHIQACAGVTTQLCEKFLQELPEGEPVDIWLTLMRLTLAIASTTFFGADLSRQAGEIVAATNSMAREFGTWMFPYAGLIRRLPTPGRRRYRKVLGELDDLITRLIADRLKTNEERNDLLSMLLAASDGNMMSEKDLRDEVATFFLTGHEALGNALTWTCYLIAQHPEVEAKLHEELDRELTTGLPSATDYGRLTYTEQVLTEAMRIYPPTWMLGRRAIRDVHIGGYTLPQGSIALLSPYVTHHDARLYRDPERFDPDRWTPDASASRPQFAYFPFGGGARRCIGEGFAWMEGVLVLAMMASRWRMRLAPGAKVELLPLFVLRPKNGVSLILERRGR